MKVNFNRIIIPSSRDDTLNLLTKFIQCKICMNILNDPYDCLCCNQTFCKSCIVNYIKTNNKCPFSEFFSLNKQKENNSSKKSNINDLLNNIKPSSSNFTKIIQSLKFYCQNNEKGCDAELNIEEISEHQKLCKYKGKKIKVELNKKIKKINNHIINSVNKSNKEDFSTKYNIKNKNIKETEKEREKENIKLYEDFKSLDSNNDLLQDNTSNQLKQQDSIVSFSGIKTFSENKNNTQFNINDIDNNTNILNNSKIEKSIEEINQKLSYINNFILNHYDSKSLYEDKSKSNKDFEKYMEKEISDFSKNFNSNNNSSSHKITKRNSMTITNNFYDGSYINTFNNYANDDQNKINDFNTVNSNITKVNNNMFPCKEKINKLDIKEDNKDKKNYNLYKSLKSKTTTVNYLLNDKESKNKNNQYTKNKKNTYINKRNSNTINMNENKKNELIEEKNNNKQNKDKKGKPKELNLSKNKITNNVPNETPKLGSKTERELNEFKSIDLKSNLNSENNNNNFYGKNEQFTPGNINEDIFNGIKNLNSKITGIERLLQSNSSFKNQVYTIQNDDFFGDIQISQNQNDDSIAKREISIKNSIKDVQNLSNNKNQKNKNSEKGDDKNENKDNVNKDKLIEEEKKCVDENISKKIEDLMTKIENSIKTILNEKFDGYKKYMEEQFTEEVKKSVLDTNFDVLTLNTDRLDEFEKMLKEKLNNLKTNE